MNSMHRQIGRIRNRGAGDSAKVSVLLNDYEDANRMLAQVRSCLNRYALYLQTTANTALQLIEASKSWRDAWVSILSSQLGTVSCFDEIYQPIVGTSDAHRDDPVMTPQYQVDRTQKLKEVYTELKQELLEEVMMMESRVTRPATEAKEFLQPIRKTIKKRENKRLDWERYIDKVNNASKKMKRSDRENAALAKAEEEQSRAAEEFKVADNHLRETLPPIIAAAFSILPHLLAVQIMIQNTLLAQYYTALHNYCEENGFQSPPPPMEEVMSKWSREFEPVKKDVEGINCIARGKAAHMSMSLGDDASGRKSITGLNIRNGISNRRPSTGNPKSGSVSPNPEARVMRIPSQASIPMPVVSPPPAQVSRDPSPDPTSNYSDRLTPVSSYSVHSPAPDYSTHLTPVSSYSAHSPAGPSVDYFQRSSNDGVIVKKKPPPPPPKRIGSQASGIFVVALYAFEGQGAGDLSFREGDRIKVVKKTESTDDWWDGELRGVKGAFPANYCKMA